MSNNPRPIKLEVPAVLAEEIRRIAEVSRRSAQSVADAVLADQLRTVTTEEIRQRWLRIVRRELGEPLPFDEEGEKEADEGVEP